MSYHLLHFAGMHFIIHMIKVILLQSTVNFFILIQRILRVSDPDGFGQQIKGNPIAMAFASKSDWNFYYTSLQID